jgi:hypothetical protein
MYYYTDDQEFLNNEGDEMYYFVAVKSEVMSKAIQLMAFANGYSWRNGPTGVEFDYLDLPYLAIFSDSNDKQLMQSSRGPRNPDEKLLEVTDFMEALENKEEPIMIGPNKVKFEYDIKSVRVGCTQVPFEVIEQIYNKTLNP